MTEKIITTDPPSIDIDDFEDFLATDDLFVDYFNTFLGLPSFPEPIRFNTESGGFEVLTSAKFEIADKIKAVAKSRSTPRPQTAASKFYSCDSEHEEEDIKTSFSVQCLDKEQGIQWIKEERFPSFVQSELYSEYRLAKLLSQVETRPGGMKLTIDPDFRPWYKPKVPPESPVSVDETELMIQRMYVTLGSTPTSQTKEWVSVAKQAQEDSTRIVPSHSQSRVTVAVGPWDRPSSSSRPTSVMSSKLDVAGDSTGFLDSSRWGSSPIEHSHVPSSARKPKMTVHFRRPVSTKTLGLESPRKQEIEIPEIILPSPTLIDVSMYAVSDLSARVGKVARVEPEESDGESDQGMGSECQSSIEDITETSIRTNQDQTDDSSELELRNLDDYSSVFVALCLKNAMVSIDKDLSNESLDDIKLFEDLLPKPKDWLLGLRYAKKPLPISKLNEKVFAEAIVLQENRVLKETGSQSRASLGYSMARKGDESSNGRSGDILDFLKLPKKKITFDETTADLESKTASSVSSDSDGYDSIFSGQSDETESKYRKRTLRYDFSDVKGFTKFKEFLKGTMGENIVQLWMDVDKTRIALPDKKTTPFLSGARQKYLRVGSTLHISRELLKKWRLEHASMWTVRNLRKKQRDMVESLLLYWGPRFLIRQSTQATFSFGRASPSEKRLLKRELRPTSSQSYPTTKTAIIHPLRPKSCLPRITKPKTESVPSPKSNTDKYHIMAMYQKLAYHPKYQQPMYHALKFKPYEFKTKEAKSLFLPSVSPKSDERLSSKALPELQRPSSAGALTMGTLAIFDRKVRSKSARETQNFIQRQTKPRRSISSQQSLLSSASKSTILGSEPMESMLQALYHDTRAGWFFTRFCEQYSNRECSNAIHFWFDAQEYHCQFYKDSIDPYVVQRKAQTIHSTYIVMDAPEQIGISKSVRQLISKSLEPAFDELFDAAEEYVLRLLILPWNEMLGEDQARYKKVELIEQERNIRVASKYASILKKKEVVKEKKIPAFSDMVGEEKYEEDLRSKVPEEFRDFTFDDLIRNRIELEHFKKYLEENYAKTDLHCWLDIESFKRVPHQASEKQEEKAKDIKTKYLHKKYFFGPSSPATKEQQNKVVQLSGGWGMTLKERPPTEMIIEAQKYVKNRLANRWLPRFLATSEFWERQRPSSQMSDVAEDIILQKKKKKGEPWKILDNKWQSSSRELVEFRHALANPVTASQFRRYVSIKRELLENDVLFWLEVQKYKDFCHAHNEKSAIEAKIFAIIHCFLDSQIPPAVQIDIPAEMAERIIQKRKELGAYVFREAQLTVFRVLFPHWSGFCEFRKNRTDEKLTTTLERQRARKMEKNRQQLIQQQNEQIAKEHATAEREMKKNADNADPLADILSSTASEASGSIAIVEQTIPSNHVRWSYGKYAEELDKERHLLLMENELKGRMPSEQLPKVDEDVSSDEDGDSIASDGESDGTSNVTRSEVSGKSSSQGGEKRKGKKRKDKVIYSTIPEDKVPVEQDVRTKGNVALKLNDRNNTQTKQKTNSGNGKVPTQEKSKHSVVVD